MISLIAAFVYTISLSIRTTGIASAILYGVGMCIPCVNILVLFIVNQKAISVLKSNNIHVGFLGADMSQFDRFEQVRQVTR